MGEEFYAAIKLITGEEIVSLVCIDENDEDPLIIMQNPIIMKMIENTMGTYIKISPWMSIPSDDFYIIRFDKVITMTEIKDKKVISLYEKYLNDEDDDSDYPKKILKSSNSNDLENQVKLSDKMGYIGSVDDARKKLENMFKNS